jgi:hypothetical protein
MPWHVEAHEEFKAEFAALTEDVQDELAANVALLEKFGPMLGRPTVDTLKGSRVSNLKELRFDADGGVWRVLFAFNQDRIAVLLVAGDKKGVNQARFYRKLIAIAEARWS